MSEIRRITLDDYNSTLAQKAIKMNPVSNQVILENCSEYNVCLEKFKIPINKYRIIDNVEKPYNISIYCDLKKVDQPPGLDLDYGFNYFQITGPIYSEDELIEKINDIILKKSQPFTLARISYELVNNTPTFYLNIQPADMVNFTNFEIYIDSRLSEIFNFVYKNNFITYDNETLYQLEPISGKQEQESFTFNNINKIDSIRIYTTLPIETHYISESYTNNFRPSSLLLEIYYNANQLLFSNDIFYIPSLLIESSMFSDKTLMDFNLNFVYKYRNGFERPIYCSKGETSLATLKFIKKNI